MLSVLTAIQAFAGITGKITGTVLDAQNKEPLIGATVIVEGTRLGAATNIEGYYVILNVPPGKYNVISSSVGYNKKTVTGVAVSVDLTTTQNFELVSDAVQVGEVIVTAERPVVKRDLTSAEARVDASTIESLPVQEISEVLSLQAGVTVDRGGGIHIRGGRTSEVAYWIDGVSVSDVYDGGQALSVDNSGIQELQVISGTFNAEYGQAMSGIVNIVTKDGDQKFRGSILSYIGDYFSGEKSLFYNIARLNMIDNRNLQGSFSGPLLPDLTFYVSGRYYKTNGWLYGNRVFNIDGSIANAPDSVRNSTGQLLSIVPKDNPVPMNGRELYQGQAKFSFQLGGWGKFALSGIGSRSTFRDYSHDLQFVPDGDATKRDKSYNLTGLWTHTLGSATFYTLNLSYLYKKFQEYQFENPLDTLQLINPSLPVKPLYAFNTFNTSNHHFERRTETRVAKFDITSQLDKLIQVKGGVEGRLHRLYFQDYNTTYDNTLFQASGRLVHAIPERTGPNYQEYTEKPTEFAAYVQGKAEYDNMIVNLGLRFDYFNSNGRVLADPQDPNIYNPQKPENVARTLEQRRATWYNNAAAKTFVSPRFGISYPITDRGVLHFSYGHFLQIPSFIFLYQKPEFKIIEQDGTQGIFGNADLEPQKTVMYEIGLQQQFGEDYSGDFTMFYRDIRDWVTTTSPIPIGSVNSARKYTQYTNEDYANARGITVSFNKQQGSNLALSLSYTFQIVEGLNSNPDDKNSRELGGADSVRYLSALNWDQTHTANLSVGYSERNDWGVFLIGRYGSGLPYTPSLNQADFRGEDASNGVRENSRRRPDNITFDLRLFKNLEFAGLELSLFAKVFNVFDTRNELDVYGQTGRATATPQNLGIGNIAGGNRVNTVEQYLKRPEFYSEPREIQFGMELNF